MAARIPAKTNAAIVPLENPWSTTEEGVWVGGEGRVLGKIIWNKIV